jgi:hypothetical protein
MSHNQWIKIQPTTQDKKIMMRINIIEEADNAENEKVIYL